MLLILEMPAVGARMREGTVHNVLVPAGVRIEKGVPLVEVRVDLSADANQNCPPISYFRIVASEAAWFRALDVSQGETRPVGAALARFTTLADEPLSGEGRVLRVSVAIVLPQPRRRPVVANG